MSASLSEQQLAGIRADLAAVPAPPWRWIGVRGAGGPQLVTDHSGRQYLLRAKKPTDARGDEVVDPQTDFPVYGDLEFRDQRAGERYSLMRPGDQLAIGRTSYDPDAIVGVDNPVARWVERSAAHAAALLAEIDRLQAERHERNEALSAAHEALAVRELFLAEYGDSVTSLHTTLAAAQACVDEAAGPDAQGRGFEWEEDEDGVHVQVWTHPETDRTLHRTLGTVLPLTVQGGAPAATDPIVAYRAPGSGHLYCVRCHAADLYTPMASDDLPDGGLCSACEVDVLITPAESGDPR